MRERSSLTSPSGLLFAGAIALSATLLASTALAGKAEDSLTYASDTEPENVSPYHNNVREGVILARHVWDTLLYRNPETGVYEPLIASDWEWLDDTTLEVTIRDGLTFHNGEELTAEDVAFTFNYVVQPDSGVVTRQNVDWIESAEVVDGNKVRIHTGDPFPAALEYLAGPTPIYPKDYFEEVGLDGFSQAPIGSGPYRITEVVAGSHVAMELFEDYFEDSPRGQSTIGNLVFRYIPDGETRIAELMTGGVDWIWRVPTDQAEMMEGAPGIVVDSGETMRVAYIKMDAMGRSSEDTPFKSREVRRAINHAVDRQAIVDNLIGGGSRVIHSACFPEQFGCEQDVMKYEYDPDKARELLAEAGYADGFETDIFAYREREYTEAVIGYLREVGINANLQFMQYAALRDLARSGRAPFENTTWGSFSVNDVSAFTSAFLKGNEDDYAQDPEVIEWLEKGDTSVDPEERKRYYSMALKKVAEEAYWLPLYSYSTNYAYTEDLEFTPSADEVPRFYRASWK